VEDAMVGRGLRLLENGGEEFSCECEVTIMK